MTKRAVGALLAMAALAGLSLAPSCGSDKVPAGGFCESDDECQGGLVCENNTCVKPSTGDCVPPCEPFETCIDGTCVPIDPGSDKDGDGWSSDEDCDDLDPFTYPENVDDNIPGGFESCDGKDNDCDGETDEGCRPCQDGDTQPCGTDIGECTPGVQTCTDGSWGACSGQGPSPEEADGLDNDCDGSADEGLPCQEGDSQPCGTDQGTCSPGQQQCEEGVWSLCLGGEMPRAETCDGLDNDCDGSTDDGFMVGLSCDGIGACGAGVFECETEETIICSTEKGGSQDQAVPEACNGLDDDCDGASDEDFQVGDACMGTGMCGAGTWECRNEAEAVCSTDPGGSQDQSREEICDGQDNDCDGSTDEGFGLGEACEGEGECGAGSVECASTTTTHCSTEPGGSQDQSQPETCDGLDNDCDGAVDDGFDVGAACDGEGECGAGVIECAGPSAAHCSTEPGGSQDQSEAERCDALDNDCDGETDEGSHAQLCSPLPDHVVNGTCTYSSSGCIVDNPATDCQEGWWDFNGVWADGCEVQMDDVANTCEDATLLPEVSDHGGGGQTSISGTLLPAGDEDWYEVRGIDNIDDDEALDGCDNYDVKITFASQPDGVVFDVSTDSCTEAGCSRDSFYRFYSNFREGGVGECPCRMSNTAGYNICSAEHHTFYVRVYRLSGYPVTDDSYEILVTNGM